MKKLLFFYLLIFFSVNGFSQWYQQNHNASFIHAVYMMDELNAFAVGGLQQGEVLRTTDGGMNWELLSSFTSAILHSVYFVNDSTGFAAGQFGTIYKTTDLGKNWTALSSNTSELVNDLEFINENVGYACGESGLVLKTTDAGNSWNEITILGAGGQFTSIMFSDINKGYVIGVTSHKTTNGGLTWQDMNYSLTTVNDIYMIDNQVGFTTRASSSEGGIFKTDDGGNTWNTYIPFDEPLYCIYFPNQDTGYACGGYSSPPLGPSSYIIKTTDGGETWWEQDAGINFVLLNLHFADSKNGIAVGGGNIISTDNGGGITDVRLTDTYKPSEFILEQNYPNPFNPSTMISWKSTVSSWQTLKVYDVLGNEIATLVDEYKSAGTYEVEFNVEAIRRIASTSGVYFYQLRTGVLKSSSGQGFVQTKKMLLLK